jgi:hypothetical protein
MSTSNVNSLTGNQWWRERERERDKDRQTERESRRVGTIPIFQVEHLVVVLVLEEIDTRAHI